MHMRQGDRRKGGTLTGVTSRLLAAARQTERTSTLVAGAAAGRYRRHRRGPADGRDSGVATCSCSGHRHHQNHRVCPAGHHHSCRRQRRLGERWRPASDRRGQWRFSVAAAHHRSAEVCVPVSSAGGVSLSLCLPWWPGWQGDGRGGHGRGAHTIGRRRLPGLWCGTRYTSAFCQTGGGKGHATRTALRHGTTGWP